MIAVQRMPTSFSFPAGPLRCSTVPGLFLRETKSKPQPQHDAPRGLPRSKQQQQQQQHSGRRTNSASPSDVATRRPRQPSPSRIPSPPKGTKIASRAQVSRVKPEDKAPLADPFTDVVDVFSPVSKGESPKPLRSPPKLACRPSGDLARRRNVDSPSASRRKSGKAHVGELASIPAFKLNKRPMVRPQLGEDSSEGPFPVCDDSSELADDSDATTPPTTPIRETSNGSASKGSFDQLFLDGPRTAPLTRSYFGDLLADKMITATPTPAQRRRNHKRVPSEGVFAMSTDEESPSSSTTDLFEPMRRKEKEMSVAMYIPRQRCYTVPAGSSSSLVATPVHVPSSSAPAATGYFAGSVFQNSPSPDDLPAPSFEL